MGFYKYECRCGNFWRSSNANYIDSQCNNCGCWCRTSSNLDNIRLYGFYKCRKCRSQWTSGYCYYNWEQCCVNPGCNKQAEYAYRVFFLEKSNDPKTGIDKDHKRNYCKKCLDGFPCRQAQEGFSSY